MRLSRALIIVSGVALFAACGGGDGNGPSNTPPTAAFNAPTCTQLACAFDGSPSTDADGSIASYSWNFGESGSGSNTGTGVSANHTYAAAGTFTVTLTVTDNGGATNSVSHDVTVTNVANQPPTAAFTSACTDLACTFTDASSDPDAGGSIASWDWDFGDNSTHATTKNTAHTFAQSGSYHVKLVVTDNQALASTAADSVVTVTVSSSGPTATFTVACDGVVCAFTDLSTTTNGPLTYQWNFGEPASGANNTSTAQNPTHTYSVTEVAPFTVTLTVTDQGGLTGSTNHTFTVTPAAPLLCNGVACTLDVTSKAILTVTLISTDCELTGNRFAITSPIRQTVFFNACTVQDGTQVVLNGPNPDKSFNAGTQIEAQFTQGIGDPEDPERGPPAIRLTGSFPTWTIDIDDGGNPTAPNEPDFDDIKMSVTAQTVP